MSDYQRIHREFEDRFYALEPAADNIFSQQDISNIRADNGTAKLKNLAVKALSSKEEGVAFNGSSSAQAQKPAAQHLAPWEFYEGAD